MNITDIKPQIDENDFLFYDIEIFKKDALVVFKDLDKNIVQIFHNDFDGLESLIKDKILVAYNNYHYDDWILSNMLLPNANVDQLKIVNDQIITGGFHEGKVSPLIFSLDCMQEIKAKEMVGLKKIEANMGKSIIETPISFDLDRALTEQELDKVIYYCSYDVDNTIDIFKIRWKSYFTVKFELIRQLDEDLQEYARKWSTRTIADRILQRHKPKTRKWRFEEVEDMESKYPFIPKEILDAWKSKERTTIKDLGCEITFSNGGLHGTNLNKKRTFKNVKLLDVASMYPHVALKLGVLSHESESKYKAILEKRLAIKHKDKTLSDALKLVLNSISGLLDTDYAKVSNRRAATALRTFCQVSLYDLATRLYTIGAEIVQLNTDGVAFIYDKDNEFEEIWHDWEKDYELTLELDEFDRFVQKDVNNYMAVRKDGSYKLIGGLVRSYFDPTDYDSLDLIEDSVGWNWNKTNTCSIVSKCVVDYYLNDISPVETINKYLDKPILFQFVLDRGVRDGVIDEHGNTDYQRYNRVFAVKKEYSNVGQLKMFKNDVDEDGNDFKRVYCFSDAPENMYLFNGDLKDLENFEKMVDIQYYVDLALSKLELWGK